MVTTVKAYAKINLALNINRRLDDGYHEVDMITVPLALHDIIEFECLPHGYETYITSDDDSLPTDESNLSYRAFIALREKYHIDKNFMIHIYKRIPMCAGLGGGSADAAAVLLAVLKMTKTVLNDRQLIEISKGVGGDVALCLFNRPARCRGIGEELQFFRMKQKYHVLLIKPNEGVSTAQAYHDYDLLEKKPERSDIEALVTALEEGDEETMAREMKNGLQASASQRIPEISTIIDRLKSDGFPLTMMSGSGSSVFTMSKDAHALAAEAKKFDRDKYRIILTETL